MNKAHKPKHLYKSKYRNIEKINSIFSGYAFDLPDTSATETVSTEKRKFQ